MIRLSPTEEKALRLSKEDVDLVLAHVRRAQKAGSKLKTSSSSHTDGWTSWHIYAASNGELLTSLSIDSLGRVYTPHGWVTSLADLFAILDL